MIATSRIQRRYDHRLQAMIKSAGSIEIALEHGIPRSTARGWLRDHDSPSVVSTDVVDQDTASLQLEVLALRRKVKRLTALLRLMFVVFKLPGPTLKSNLLREVDVGSAAKTRVCGVRDRIGCIVGKHLRTAEATKVNTKTKV
jgi:hypothetical protein